MRLPHGRTTWTFSTRTRLSTQPWTSVWNVGRTQWFCTNLAVAPSKLAVPGWWLYFEGAETHHGSMPQALSRVCGIEPSVGYTALTAPSPWDPPHCAGGVQGA
ncbi:MAG: hypothetical protein QOF99_8756 [Pseudonocardiales bacterium]|nr:hypothetical protein [Pseudonocardiales bacterium]